jgi:hypothetical protein
MNMIAFLATWESQSKYLPRSAAASSMLLQSRTERHVPWVTVQPATRLGALCRCIASVADSLEGVAKQHDSRPTRAVYRVQPKRLSLDSNREAHGYTGATSSGRPDACPRGPLHPHADDVGVLNASRYGIGVTSGTRVHV